MIWWLKASRPFLHRLLEQNWVKEVVLQRIFSSTCIYSSCTLTFSSGGIWLFQISCLAWNFNTTSFCYKVEMQRWRSHEHSEENLILKWILIDWAIMVITCRYRQISWELLVSELQSLVGPEMRLHLGLCFPREHLIAPPCSVWLILTTLLSTMAPFGSWNST